MDDSINIGKRILKTLNNNGFEAYFVGEAVRNFILKKKINRVDITTNANTRNIKKLFMEYDFEDIDDRLVVWTHKEIKFYISTFVSKKHEDFKLNYTKHYSKNLLDYLSGRDFTIDAIAMSYSGKITDPFNGYTDLQKKKISLLGKGKIKIHSDPSIIIKAFSLMSELDYGLSLKTKKEINKHRKCLREKYILSYREEFKKIFDGPYAKKAIIMMTKTNIDMVLPTFKKVLRLLSNYYKKASFQEVLMMSFILNGKINKEFESLIENYNSFMKIYDVAMTNTKSNFDAMTLFKYGLDTCLSANKINNMLRFSKLKTKRITKKWNTLKIKQKEDLVYGGLDIQKIIQVQDYFIIDNIINEVCESIILGEINNDEQEIKNMVLELLGKNNVEYDLSGFNEEVKAYTETKSQKNYTQQGDLDTINRHLMKQQQRNTRNNNEYISKKDNDMTSLNLNFLYENEIIKNKIKDNKDFEEKLQKFISGYIESDAKEDTDEED